MLNSIKRTWVPKNVAAQTMQAAAPADAAPAYAPSIYAGLDMFDDLPSPHAQEVNSESIWAAFDDVPSMAVAG